MPKHSANIETAIMPFKLQQLITIIMEKKQLGVEDAFHYLYTSDCYQLLLQEETKLWYMSGLGIYDMLEEEKKAGKRDDTKLLLFYAFCIERYKNFKHYTAEETLAMFRKHHVFDYLREGYEVLHTQGEDYIVNEIDLYFQKRQK